MFAIPAFLTGGLVKYLILGLIGLGLAGWAVNGITAPYRSQISRLNADIASLHKAARQRAELEAKDRARAEADAAELARLEATLEATIHDHAKAPNACKLSVAERSSLQHLASGGTRKR